MSASSYDWKRFWCPRDGSINLTYRGCLADPDGPYGNHFNPALRPFGEVSEFPCLPLLGEPGIGKTSTMQAERSAIDAAVLAEGGKTLWLDLRSCGSEDRLINKLFESREFKLWLEGDYRLHVFLDSLDECLLRVDTVGRCSSTSCRTTRSNDFPSASDAALQNGRRSFWRTD